MYTFLSKTFFLCLCLILSSCLSKSNSVANPSSDIEESLETIKISEDSEWYPLYKRLQDDGVSGDDVDDYFARLEGKFTTEPMGMKVTELYNIKFKKREPAPTTTTPPKTPTPQAPNPTGVPRPWYRGFVTDETAKKCVDFIKENQTAFTAMEEKYNIPKEVIAALLYVETKHGTFLGQYSPIVNLASMSNSTRMEQIPNEIDKLPLAQEQSEWILERMKEKSDWSYKELQALIHYCREYKHDPFELQSSVYGALGFGQFMPTNIPLFAVDGDDDGIIDLFTPADALMSSANYLSKHGWNKENLNLSQKIRIIKRYNHSTIYANTIMALSVLTEKELKKVEDVKKDSDEKKITEKEKSKEDSKEKSKEKSQ